jgi:uncharacterized membrane protein
MSNICTKIKAIINKKQAIFYTFIILAIVLVIINQVAYFAIFGGSFSNNHTVWSEFGSFFGGFVGALLSFINIMFVIMTLRNQTEQLAVMKSDIEEQKKGKEKYERKEKIDYYEKIFNDSINQKNMIKNAFESGSGTGDQVFNKSVKESIDLLRNTDEILEHQYHYARENAITNKYTVIENTTKYISLLHIIVETIRTIQNSELEEMEKNELISKYNRLLSDYELKYLVICKSIKEMHDSIDIVNKALGLYESITLNDLKINSDKNIRSIGASKGILTFIF